MKPSSLFTSNIFGALKSNEWSILATSENFDTDSLPGFLSLKGYHLTPDKGLGIICFDTQQNLQKNIPVVKEMFADYQDRFNCKITFDTGIENHDLFINK